jgi:hypothetical protein
MQCVPLWLLAGVEPWGWDEVWQAVDHAGGPLALVQAMISSTTELYRTDERRPSNVTGVSDSGIFQTASMLTSVCVGPGSRG